MYLAHTGVALTATGVDRRVPLVWLMVAAWAFDITGVGHWAPVAVALAAVAFELGRRRWDVKVGVLLAVVVLSHDVLDLVVGVQLLPGGRFIGWDLGNDSSLEPVLELAVLAVGTAVYLATLPGPARRRPIVLLALGAIAGATVLKSALVRSGDEDPAPLTLAGLAVGAIATSILLVRADREARATTS